MNELLTNLYLLLHGFAVAVREVAPFVLIYLAIVNIAALSLYGLDKRYAQKKRWRIPEATLIAVALLYGALGAFLGMRIFRHKTKHKKFTITVPILLILQIAFAAICVGMAI